jgi:outer membrane protein assembly factor BamB
VELPEVSGGMACSSAATDGRRVYAIFANGDLAAFDFNGTLAWARSFAPVKNQYGHAASLELWQDRVIVQLDHGDSDTKISRIIAVNTADGKTAWEKPRATHGTWSTPIAGTAAGKPQIITLGLPHVISYSATDGAELWRVEGIDGEITPSPIFAGGFVLAPSPSTKLYAIKPDGSGDVTKTHVAWNAEEGVPDITCPVSDGARVYLLGTGGTLTCLDLSSGKKIWEKELDLEFKASPCLAGNKLYLASTKGTVIVAEAGAAFKELARAEIADELVATPAFADGKIIFRAKQNMICVGNNLR